MNNSISGTIYHNPDKMKEFIEAREKLAEIGCLAVGLAHEINNPLDFVIINFNTLAAYFSKYKKIIRKIRCLKDGKSKAAKKSLSDKIYRLENLIEEYNIDFITNELDSLFRETEEGLRRIKEIAVSVKEFSRVEHRKDFRKFYLSECIDKALLLARNEIRHVAAIEKDYSMALLVHGNQNQMVQVFLNLILNAAQAIRCRQQRKPGRIRIHIRFDEKFVYCEISDDGIGIPRDNISSVFEPFFTTNPFGCGTGLGLSISYDIVVNRHNGEIFVESTPGAGTKFTVKLPLR